MIGDLISAIENKQAHPFIGNKAFNLSRLLKSKRRIPKTFVCNYLGYQRYLANDEGLDKDLKAELQAILDPDVSYAVRSSANFEDSSNQSFAGQFSSILACRGIDAVIEAIHEVWESARSPQAQSYFEATNLSAEELQMGVIIQEMISAQVSGVALSKNPVQGTDETVIEAVSGMGDQLVQDGVTPSRWINKWGYWIEKPEEEVLPISVATELVKETKEIEREFGFPVDLEWVYDGKNTYWVQLREITSLSNETIYSNYISKEFLPGLIKPLIYSVNIPLVNGVWIDWIEEITGDLGIPAEDLAKHIYYRVYFNMDSLGKIFAGLGFPRESVEILMGIIPPGAARPTFKPTLQTFMRLPWLIRFAVDKWFLASKMRRAMKRLERQVKAQDYRNLSKLSLQDINEIVDYYREILKELAYFNVLGPLFMGMYNSALGRSIENLGVSFTEFDLTGDMEELKPYDPDKAIKSLHQQFIRLPKNLQMEIIAGKLPESTDHPKGKAFLIAFNEFMERFGHLSDSGNDFSSIPWREIPEMVIGLISTYSNKERKKNKIRISDIKVTGFKKFALHFLYRRAREYRLLREQVSSLYTYGYGMLRYQYLAIGEHMAADGFLQRAEDIYYLTDSQTRDIQAGILEPAEVKSIVQKHKRDMDMLENISLPSMVIGDEVPPIETRKNKVMLGVASSMGVYTGPARKVHGLSEIEKVQEGDVLVISHSDVSWTPLFRRAGAVVAEAGGLLSHSSIVAREYGIPAVVNVPDAMMLADDALITVDGNNGKIMLLEEEE